jgi:PAS domain S-box-containing protein
MTARPSYEELERRIQELEKTESERNFTENFLKKIFDNTQDAIFIHDLEGKILDVNDKMCRMYRLTKNEALEVNIGDISSSKMSMEILLERWQKVLNGEKLLFEWEALRPKEKTVFNVEVSIQKISFHDKDIILANVRDITERKRADEKLRHRLVYEQMLSQISKMAVQQEDLEQFLNDSLTILGETLDISRAYIFEYHHETDSLDNTVEWCASDETPQKDALQGVPAAPTPWWMAMIKDGRIICFSDIEDIPDEGAKEILRPQGICSIVVVPLFVADLFHGFMGFDECRFHREWPEEDVEILLTISRIIAGVMYKKQAQEEIERERQQLLSILNSIEENIYISDPETYEILHVNPTLANTLQRDCVGGICYKEFHGLDLPCAFCTNDIILKYKPQPHYWEYYNSRLEQYFSIVDRIIEWPDGRNVRFEMAKDITDHKQAEEALRESEERYRTILNEMAEGYHEVDLAGNFTFFNDAFLNLFGYSREEMTGTNFSRYAAEESSSKKVYQTYNEIYKTGNPVQRNEWDIIRKDGQRRTLEYNAAVLKDSKNIPKGFRGIVRDITENRQAEMEREKLQTQLNQAQKMESIGRLAGGVAHDFNNMLGVILGHAELALQKARNKKDPCSNLEKIQTAARRSADLTKQLLAFARKQIIEPKPLDLNHTVEKMLSMLRRLIGEDIDLSWVPARKLWPVIMDPSQVDQILANLCVNARDAIAGVGKLTIETGMKTFDPAYCADHPGFIPGGFVMLAVSDNGCGMDQEILENLFEPFFTTKDIGKGTGLGLATIYGIVKQNNGFINVYSEPGQGSTFKIYLPRQHASAEERASAAHSEKSIPTGNETILLVEDDPEILKMTRTMLEQKGYSVLSAVSPVSAIRIARARTDRIHLLITDVIMPEMNGRDLAEQVRGLFPEIKLLFMSGYTANVIVHQGMLNDGVAFLQKPFSINELAEKVREVLDTASDKN